MHHRPAPPTLYAPAATLTTLSAPRRMRTGAAYPVHGLRLLWHHRELWPWAAGPFLLTAWAIVGALVGAFWWSDDLLALLWPRPQAGGILAWAWHALAALVTVVLTATAAVVLWILGNMAASPFYDVLAERVERLVLDREDEDFDWRVVLGDAWLSIRHSVLGLLLYAGVMLPLLLLHLVPGLGSVLYAVLSGLATVAFMARELMDIPLSRRRASFRAKLAWIRQHKALLAGLGATSALLVAIPFVNLFVMPIAVMGGTLLYCHLDLEGHGVPPR